MLYIVVTIITVILIYIFLKLKGDKLVFQKSNIDNRNYLVNDLPDKQDAANTLAEIRRRLILLAEKLSPDFKYQNGLLEKVKNMELMENPKLRPPKDMISYAINKEKVVLCLRDVSTGNIHDINILMYVAVHEMAHLSCPEFGHGALWYTIFQDLLKEAIRVGVYSDENYVMNPKTVCGLIVDERII